MSVIGFGQELPSAYMDTFAPVENVPTRVSMLLSSGSLIAAESHYLDFEHLDVKGSKKCMGAGSLCCKAFGTRSQTYAVAVLVYKAPPSTEGAIQVWKLPRRLYQQVQVIASQYNLNEIDLLVTRTKQGRGYQTQVLPCSDQSLRKVMSAEQLADLEAGEKMFLETAEDNMIAPFSPQDWQKLLMDLGWDFQRGCWGNQAVMGNNAAMGAIGQVAHGNQMGMTQLNAPQGFQTPTPPAFGTTPPPVQPAAQVQAPPPVQTATAAVPPAGNPVAPPVQAAPAPTAQPVAPPVQTAPVQATPPPVQTAPVPVAPPEQVVPANQVIPTAEGSEEITDDELSTLLN